MLYVPTCIVVCAGTERTYGYDASVNKGICGYNAYRTATNDDITLDEFRAIT